MTLYIKPLVSRYHCNAWNCYEASGLRYYQVWIGDVHYEPPFCKVHAQELLSDNSKVEVCMGEPDDDGDFIAAEVVEEPEQDEVKTLTTEAGESLAMVREFQIQTNDDLGFANEVLVDVKTRLKRLDALKKSITAPMNEALKAARELFRPAESALADIEFQVKTKVAAYSTAALNAQRKALEAATDPEATADEVQDALDVRAEAEVVAPKGMGLREVWKFEVVDSTKVPRLYCKPDEATIRAAVAAGGREIPGVRIWRDTQVSVRT